MGHIGLTLAGLTGVKLITVSLTALVLLGYRLVR
jgi:hypothetical protein